LTHSVFRSALCAGVTINMSLHYNSSTAVKMYRRHRYLRSSSASQKRLPTCLKC